MNFPFQFLQILAGILCFDCCAVLSDVSEVNEAELNELQDLMKKQGRDVSVGMYYNHNSACNVSYFVDGELYDRRLRNGETCSFQSVCIQGDCYNYRNAAMTINTVRAFPKLSLTANNVQQSVSRHVYVDVLLDGRYLGREHGLTPRNSFKLSTLHTNSRLQLIVNRVEDELKHKFIAAFLIEMKDVLSSGQTLVPLFRMSKNSQSMIQLSFSL